MAKIRQEINIPIGILSATSGASASSNSVVQLDTTQYNGASYYFEVVADSTTSLAFDVTLVGATDGTLATISVPVLTTAYTLFRSSSFTPTTATQNCTFSISNAVGASKNVKSARIIVLQNATTLTNTETQIEIGGGSDESSGDTTTSTTDTAYTRPKYWQYIAANWDGTLTVYFESTFLSGTSKSAATMTLQTSTSITAPSWSNVASSAVTTTSTTATRVRSGAITLVDGNWYRAVRKAGNSKSGITAYNAKVIIDQAATGDFQTSSVTDGFLNGGSGTLEQLGQSFTAGSSYSTTVIALYLAKQNSPTDNLTLEVLTGSITGTVIATSNTVACSSLGTSFAYIPFTFSSSISIASGTKYYLRLSRDGARDTFNRPDWRYENTSVMANGGAYTKDSGSWSSESTTDDFAFKVYNGFTKIEPQYLLANTLFAAGTGLQTFLTDWDSTEWDAESGSITYYFQAEAANDSTSDVTLEQADGGGTVTNSTLTNIDNAQISSALTMPGNENLDTKATTNAGDVAAARILVAYVFAAAPAVPDNVPYTNANLKALQIMDVGV